VIKIVATITATPSSLKVGEIVTIAYTGSNGGPLKITLPTGSVYSRATVVGSGSIIYTPTLAGSFKVELISLKPPRKPIARTSFTVTSISPPPPPPDPLPTAPTGLKATGGDKLVNLSWEVVALAVSYKIYRDNVAVGTSTSPSFTNTGLTNGQSYSFKVSAVNAVGEGPFSNSVSATPLSSGTTINVPSGGKGVTITQNNQIVENLTIIGPGATESVGTYGIYANGAYSGVVIRNCTIKNISGSGMWLINLVNPVIEDCIIEDVAYSGIMTLGWTGGRISRNTIRRVGVNGPFNGNNNAYGIAISGLTSTTRSSDVIVNDNIITDVPFWHGLDTHGGLRITFSHNTVRRSPRAVFITSGDFSGGEYFATSCVIKDNLFTEPVQVSGGTNPTAMTTYATSNCSFTGNHIGAAYGSAGVYDYLGQSTGLVQSNNIISETLPTVTIPAGFLSYTARSPFTLQDVNDIELSYFTIKDFASVGITLRRVKRAYIHHVDLANLVGGIYLDSCEDIIIEDVRGRNIGDGTIGSGHSNYIQFATTRGGAVRRCKFLGGRTEDMISIWHSGGWSSSNPLLIEDNKLQGLVSDTTDAKAWTSSSGTGIIISDGAGHAYNGNVTVRRNTLLTPGQVGIQHIDGPNIKTYSNIVYGQQRSNSNVGMSSWEGTPYAEIYSNQVRWYAAGGNENPYWWVNPAVINEHDNDWHANIDPNSLVVVL
jgi:hypothetical protein